MAYQLHYSVVSYDGVSVEDRGLIVWLCSVVQSYYYYLRCTLYTVQCSYYYLQCTVYTSLHCTLYTVYNLHFSTVYTVRCTVYTSVQCTLYNVYFSTMFNSLSTETHRVPSKKLLLIPQWGLLQSTNFINIMYKFESNELKFEFLKYLSVIHIPRRKQESCIM